MRLPRRPSASIWKAAGLSKRDYVPLAIAIFVDICLLLVSIGRPMNRLGGLVPQNARGRARPHDPDPVALQ